MISADRYAAAIHLAEPFVPPRPTIGIGAPAARRVALEWLLAERGTAIRAVADDAECDVLIRNLLTVRRPGGIPPHVQACLDETLADRTQARGTVTPGDAAAAPGSCATILGTILKVWRGDITRLSVDAIVNAANAELLGCFRPGHACIDNVIHWAAGPRLREDCARIMEIQGHAERTGDAKITRAYHLPSRFVLHTVGPIVDGGRVRPEHQRALVSSYRSCLDLARSVPSIRTVAFCAISTGVYGYPKDAAARLAVRSVESWLREHPGALDLAIFTVFTDADAREHEAAMRTRGEEPSS